MALLKMCRFGGCHQYARPEHYSCMDHAEWEARRENRRRGNHRETPSRHAKAMVYADPRWKRCRAVVLQRDDYTCLWCGATDDLTVDHVQGIHFDDSDYDPELCQTLCRSCHGRKSNGDMSRANMLNVQLVHVRSNGG